MGLFAVSYIVTVAGYISLSYKSQYCGLELNTGLQII